MAQVLLWFALAAAVDAPVTEVTVYSDRARVVRTVTLTTAGAQTIELPVLPQSTDPRSVRVEAAGAEVKRVDLTRLEDDALPMDEAKKLIVALQQTDDELSKLNGESAALAQQAAAFNRIAPVTPPADPLKPNPKLNAAGWAGAMAFVADGLSKVQARQREVQAKQQALGLKKNELTAKAQTLGATQTRFGWKVVAQLAGGAPTLRLTYFVDRARWYPLYDLALNSDTGKVNVAFSGLVSQESGEDWNEAALTLSTAVPATATTLPKPTTWKIGEAERFIPTPTPVRDVVRPPPPVPALPVAVRAQDVLRARLLRTAGVGYSPASPGPMGGGEVNFDDDSLEGELRRPDDRMGTKREEAKEKSVSRPRPQAAPPSEPMPVAEAPAPGRYQTESVTVSDKKRGFFFSGEEREPPPTSGFSLSPPPGYRPPSFAADLPAAAAGGYDLVYVSLQKETVPSGKGARKVALFTEAWPVKVERKLFPALFPEAFLVAELKSPSPQPLPAGSANLYVGDDPAGTARLKLVSPGEAFTLPLGIDRALRPVRNVKIVQSEHGLISKDEVTQYVVTLELANPYRAPVAVRLIDQIPVTTQKDVEIVLAESKPAAAVDKRTGALEWRLSVPAAQKTIVSFTYSVKRPKGWLLQQSEVTP